MTTVKKEMLPATNLKLVWVATPVDDKDFRVHLEHADQSKW